MKWLHIDECRTDFGRYKRQNDGRHRIALNKDGESEKQVFQLQFAVGEFDMVVADNANATCEIYEVKHSKEQAKEQYRHLIDEEKLKSTEFRYGKITKKSCYLPRRKYDFGKRNRIQKRRRISEITCLT